MKVLAIDTSTSLLGIALQSEERYFEINQDVGLHHSENLLTEVQYILKKSETPAHELDLIVVAKGPGSFTGLRIGISTAKGLSFGLEVPVVSVPTLDMYAYCCKMYTHKVLSLMDARKNRVYAAFYTHGLQEGEILDIAPAELIDEFNSFQDILLTGPYAGHIFELYSQINAAESSLPPASVTNSNRVSIDPLYAAPKTYALLKLGIRAFERNGADAENQGPLYIRPSEAEMSLQKKRHTDETL
ncbi:MAG: tRNA (adenosine(37)-N6)-threonylcarbamoyltransferase complex dimerization subunit type 1 TsaB [Spirochaetia bacterium]|nr:tRNA (adenosine(37)-N6)-threonylcarbamoyltransferase complex dimerization subunit type 1 TsaB [Spirochaetia bacterium]